nr:uncharacterized protein LOC109155321 [Ipomoea batatas]
MTSWFEDLLVKGDVLIPRRSRMRREFHDNINFTSMGESKYAYLQTNDGLYRVNIPDFDPAHQPEFMLDYAPASQRCIPWDKVKPINDKSNEKEPKRKPGVVYLEDNINFTSMEESKYAYLVTDDGLYRVNIPDFDPPHQPEFMLECVAEDFDDIIPPTMGIFSKGQDVYLFGGLMFGGRGNAQYNRSLYFFNPHKVKEKEYPIRDSNYAPASQRCIPWDKVKPINDKSNEKEPKRKPGVVYLEPTQISYDYNGSYFAIVVRSSVA